MSDLREKYPGIEGHWIGHGMQMTGVPGLAGGSLFVGMGQDDEVFRLTVSVTQADEEGEEKTFDEEYEIPLLVVERAIQAYGAAKLALMDEISRQHASGSMEPT